MPVVKKLEKCISTPATGLESRMQEVEKSVKYLSMSGTSEAQGATGGAAPPEALCKEVMNLDACMDSLEQQVQTQERQLDILTSWAGTMYHAHGSLRKQVQFNTSKHHSNDLIVGGIYEYSK